jgi:3D (Asp-Asp-Asp) domain-containing protein
MSLKSILIGIALLLKILVPLNVFASQESLMEVNKDTLIESQKKNNNIINVSESILRNYPYLPEALSVYARKTKPYATQETSSEAVYGKMLNILVTGYSSTPDQCWGDPFTTASGARGHEGTMACPPEYVFGTKIEIENMGTYVCEDRGGKIKGNHFDMWFVSRGEALNWGKRTIEARIIQS